MLESKLVLFWINTLAQQYQNYKISFVLPLIAVHFPSHTQPHISPSDMILTELITSIESQCLAHITKSSFKFPLSKYFLATLVGFFFWQPNWKNTK